jgi:hypothetical protein
MRILGTGVKLRGAKFPPVLCGVDSPAHGRRMLKMYEELPAPSERC